MTEQLVYWLRTAERPDVDCYLREVAQIGVRDVFVGGHGVADIRPGAQTGAKALAEAMAETGVSIHTIHALFGGRMDLGVTDEAERAVGLDTHRNTLRVAAGLGARNVVFHIGGMAPQVSMDCVLLSIEALLPVAQELGVALAIENLPPGLLGAEPQDLVTIMEEFDSPLVGICLDTGHANLTGGCGRWLDAIGSRINMVHLHDNCGDEDTHLPPGMGTVDWGDLKARVRACGYTGPWVSETRMQPGWTAARLHGHFQEMFG